MEILKYNLYVIPDVIAELKSILSYYSDPKYFSICMGTVAAESGFEVRAKENYYYGLALMTVGVVETIFGRILQKNLGGWHEFTKLWLGLETVPYFLPARKEIVSMLTGNDRFALALLYLYYKNADKRNEKIPEDIKEQAHYYVCYYNPKGTFQNYMESISRYSLTELLAKEEVNIDGKEKS